MLRFSSSKEKAPSESRAVAAAAAILVTAKAIPASLYGVVCLPPQCYLIALPYGLHSDGSAFHAF